MPCSHVCNKWQRGYRWKDYWSNTTRPSSNAWSYDMLKWYLRMLLWIGLSIMCHVIKLEKNLTTKFQDVFYALSHRGIQFLNNCLDKVVSLHPELHISVNASMKAYGTHVTTRAAYHDLTCGISTNAILLALRRFLARRRVPLTLYSNSALPFRTPSWYLLDIALLLSTHPRQFISLGMSWDGWWERLIRSFKSSLRKVPEKSMLNSEETLTVLLEAEAVVNSKPLTYTYMDSKEPSPICTAHFLVGRSLLASKVQTNNDYEARSAQATRCDISSKWWYHQKLTDHLWIRWKREYLLELRALHLYQAHPSSCLQVDDMVIIEEPGISRGVWPLGQIVEIYPLLRWNNPSLPSESPRWQVLKTSTEVVQAQVVPLYWEYV